MGPSASLFDRVSEVFSRGDMLNQIAKLIEEDTTTTKRLTMEASAVLIAGSARRLASGSEPLGSLLSAADTAVLSAPQPLEVIDPRAGSRPMMQMLGNKWPVYLQGLADVNGLSLTQVESVFNRIAPIVAAAVRERQQLNAIDHGELVEILRAERDRMTNLGLLSWAPHSNLRSRRPGGAALRSGRNVAKNRSREAATQRIYGGGGGTVGDSKSTWLFWLLALGVLALALAWTLSLVL